PFIIVALFGGYKYTFPLYIVLNIYRFLIGGAGILQSFLFSTIMFILIPILSKWFLGQNARKRVLWGGLATILTMVLYLTTLAAQLPVLNHEFWILTINAVPTDELVMVIIMILIQKIIDNNITRKSSLQSERFNVLSDLSASVSHEIRNQLT